MKPQSGPLAGQGDERPNPVGTSLYSILKAQAERDPNAVAIVSSGAPPLTYGQMIARIDSVIAGLRAAGIARNDRVPIVLPNGPEMAVAFLAVTCLAASAPLNPAYRAGEFEFYISDLRAKALLIQAGMDSPARETARSLGVPIIEITPLREMGSGSFSIADGGSQRVADYDLAEPEDDAMVLHTSGTTSRPKVVTLTHTNICASARNMAAALQISTRDRCLNVMPLFHIHALVGALLTSLTAGASIVCTPGFYAPQFFQWLEEFDPTWYTAAPTIHQAVLARAEQNRKSIQRCRLRLIRSSAAPLPPPVLSRLEQAFHVPVIESYGMTEAAMQITSNPLPPRQRKVGSVGVAWGPDVAIVGADGSMLGANQPGEIVIRGTNVISRYDAGQEINNAAFINGWLRTGDQGRVDEEGYLFLTGRLKEVINRGAEKISPREVDDAIISHPDVYQVITFAVPDDQLGEEVAAAVVLRPHATATERTIRNFASERLADFKVPRRVFVLDELPKGPTGKLQRIGFAKTLGLTTLRASTETAPAAYLAPRDRNEETLSRIWTEVLGVERVGVHDDFFHLGGDSVLAASIVARMDATHGVKVTLLDFFDAPTVSALAHKLDSLKEDAQGEAPPDLQRIPRQGPLELSYAQQRLWLLHQLESEKFVYNIHRAVRLKGQLQVDALSEAIDSIAGRHESLRTRFVELENGPGQLIAQNCDVSLSLVDLSGCTEMEREQLAKRLAVEEARRPFDLSEGSLLRATLLKLGGQDHALMLTIHHIVSDGWSMRIFFDELTSFYEAAGAGRQARLAELKAQYVDYASWQRQWLEQGAFERQLSYWRHKLSGELPVFELPTSRPRPPVMTFRGAKKRTSFRRSVVESLKELSRCEGITPFMVVLAAFKSLLHRYTGQEDIIIGSPVAGRSRVEIEGLIGFFVNTLVLRTDLSGDPSFLELLARVRKSTLEAYANEDVPFEKLVQELQPDRQLSHMPLVQVMIQLRNLPRTAATLSELDVEEIHVDNHSAKFDLALEFHDSNDGLDSVCEYSTDLFEGADVTRLMRHFQTLLQSALDEPERSISSLALITKSEEHQLLVEWNDTEFSDHENSRVWELIEQRVERSPDAVAVAADKGCLSYRELNVRANQLAHHLRSRGIGPEVRVAVYLRRSVEMVVGLLAVMKARGTYVPLDPAYPANRISWMLEDSQAAVLLSEPDLIHDLDAHRAQVLFLTQDWPYIASENQDNIDAEACSETTAYLIYTSGSTGKPKGVQITHGGLVNLVKWHLRTFGMGASERAAQLAGLGFDAAAFEVWPCLAAGAAIYLPDDETRSSLDQLGQWLIARAISITFLPTPLTESLLASEWRPPISMRTMLTGGDTLHSYAGKLSPCRLFNNYGPTENTIVTAAGAVPAMGPDGVLPDIGRPIANTAVHILDRQLRPAPIGIRGEICISGDGLAPGYLGRPALTAQSFIPNPVGEVFGGRLYRTGDLGRFRADGTVEFFGRNDYQIKLRGYRIELGEIEKTLANHPSLTAAVVVVRESGSGSKTLVAYVVEKEAHSANDDALQSYLREQLPEYMVPAMFVTLNALPMTPNGKIDRRALPAPGLPLTEQNREWVAPSRPAEELIANIWSDVLKLERVGIHQNFFALGGHSLIAAQVISRVRNTFNIEATVRLMFECPTIAELAKAVQSRKSGESQLSTVAMRRAPRDEVVPLSFAQRRLWFMDQLTPATGVYNIPIAISVAGGLSAGTLIQSFSQVIRRQQALRTVFLSSGGEPEQKVAPYKARPVGLIDLRTLSPEEKEDQLQRLLEAQGRRPFDLAREEPARSTVVQMEASRHVFALTTHHIVSDGWSTRVFFDELSAHYESYICGRPAALPELVSSYSDFTLWEREMLEGPALDKGLSYWRETLTGAPESLDLTTDKPRPAVLTYSGAAERFRLAKDLTAAVKQLGRENGATLFMTLLAAFKALLQRYSNQNDIVLGIPAANRNLPEVEPLIGFFVNTLPIRTNAAPDQTFVDLLLRVKEATLGASAHQELPFEKLVEELAPERSLSQMPVFQVMFAFENAEISSRALADLDISPVRIETGTEKYDLTLFVVESGESLSGTLSYSTDLFEATTAKRMVRHFESVLKAAAANPRSRLSEAQLLSEAERQAILNEWNDTYQDYPRTESVDGLIQLQVEKAADAIAIEAEQAALSYGELNRWANQLAHFLRRQGVAPGAVIGVCLERSLEMVIAFLGVMKAGGAYLPLDPDQPADRIRFMLSETQTGLLISQQGLADRLHQLDCVRTATGTGDSGRVGSPELILVDRDWAMIARESAGNPQRQAMPESRAYVMYTSGSTGTPKGISISHQSVKRLVLNADYVTLTAEDKIAQVSNSAFDAATFEIWGALLHGARLVIINKEVVINPAEFARRVRVSGVTTMFLTSALFNLITLEAPTAFAGMRNLLVGGDVLDPRRIHEVLTQGAPERLLNGYGPTESTTFAVCGLVRQAIGVGASIPIGRPIANTVTYVLDKCMRPSPLGAQGELYIGGDGLADGYLNQAMLTAERFQPNPFGDQPGARLYQTGDVVRYLADGSVEFVRRSDNQVKLRGFRVELGEIEAALSEHQAVREAVVIAVEEKGEKHLVAYVVQENGQTISARELRRCLSERLPDYMTPGTVIFVDSLPLTPTGKVDRRSLPKPVLEARMIQEEDQTARTAVQEVIASIWEDVLGLERVGVDENFFELGGHSLKAMQVISRIREALKVDVQIRNLFETPTISGLSERIGKARRIEHGELKTVCRDKHPRASYAQERLWFQDQLEPGSCAYNIPCAFSLKGRLSVSALVAALNEIIRRHEALRTAFGSVDGQLVQIIKPHRSFYLPLEDLRSVPEVDREAAARKLAIEEAHSSFDLSQGPMMRTCLLRMDEEHHILLLTLHHIASDGWSMGILFQEMQALYGAFASNARYPLAELRVQYADYSMWQREWLEAGAADAQLSYWRKQLEGAQPALELPTNRIRPAVQSFRSATRNLALPGELTDGLRNVSRARNSTLFMLLLGAFHSLLHRYTGQESINVGTPLSGRNRTETEELIGFFVNTLVIRGKVGDDPSFEEFLKSIRDAVLEGHANQDVPFERVVEALQPDRNTGRTPLFQVMFVFKNGAGHELRLDGLAVNELELESPTEKFDLTLSVKEADGGLTSRLRYNTDLFEPDAMGRMLQHYRVLLDGVAANPRLRISQLPWLTASELRQVLVDWNETRVEYPTTSSIQELFEKQAVKTPDAVALVCEEEELTYRELNARSNQLAHFLKRRGVRPEDLIGVMMTRRPEMVAALLAILKAGGAYVPLDPAYPVGRVQFMLEDTGARVLLTQQTLAGSEPAGGCEVIALDSERDSIVAEREENPGCVTNLENLAYVIYTSGSTGRPKGVAITHRSAVTLLHWSRQTYSGVELKAMLASTSICFDLSVFEIFVPLSWGGQVILVENALSVNEEPSASQATLINTVPSAMTELVRMRALPATVKTVNLAGETLKKSLVDKIYEESGVERVTNLYGPSEDTTYSTWTDVKREAKGGVTIGRPIANTRIYILDARQEVSATGVTGELYIGGEGLCRGYLKRPEMTAEKFVPDPFSAKGGERLYRTGDLAAFQADGDIEFLGRIDTQVKIRGFRIEPGEVESILGLHPGLREAVIVACPDGSGHRLVAFCVASRLPAPPLSELREFLRCRLPEYMVPLFVMLDKLPLTPTGKIDRRALAESNQAESEEGFVAPRNQIEELLAGIWHQTLNLERVGIHDNFFELGGHSLLATNVIWRVRETFHNELPLRTIFDSPSIAELAEVIARIESDGASAPAPALCCIPRDEPLPVSFAQSRLWFLDRLEPGNIVYNMPLAVRLDGKPNVATLEQSISEITRRHETLRTVFGQGDGVPTQQVLPYSISTLRLVDLRSLASSDRVAQAQRLLREESTRPFDLARPPLLRKLQLQTDDASQMLILNVHHIIFDGWSTAVLGKELSDLYAAFASGFASSLPDLSVQYPDFAEWQREWLKDGVLERQLAYWRQALGGAPAMLDLPTDRPRPAVRSYAGGLEQIELGQELSDSLARMTRSAGSTVFMTLLGAFTGLLQRYSGQEVFAVGVPIANRIRPEFEPLIGLFVNTLALRMDVSGNPACETMLERVREAALGAYAHQDLPFEKLVEAIEPERILGRTPIFQVMFVFQNTPAQPLNLNGLAACEERIETGTERFDLTLALRETQTGIRGALSYNTDVFDHITCMRMVKHFRALLNGIVHNPQIRLSELELLNEGERQQLLVEWNDTTRDYSLNGTLHELIEAQVELTPDAIAIVYEGSSVSYRELDRRANRLSNALRRLGVGPEVTSGIFMEPSDEMIVAVLGILKSGGAYLPLDLSHPKARLAFVCEDARVCVLITQQRLSANLPDCDARVICIDAEWATLALADIDENDYKSCSVRPDNSCYVIYTSGSTGKPKGVQIEHRAVSNFLNTMRERPGVTSKDVLLSVTNLSFDIAALEIFLPLSVGARVVVASTEMRSNGKRLMAAIASSGATVAQATPVTWRLLLDAGWLGSDRLRMLCGGESLSQDLADRLVERGHSAWNMYGPTETTIWSLVHQFTAGDEKAPIGRPIANTEIYLLDRNLQPVPVGAPGELHIGGTGLARGYINLPEQTADRFIHNPFSNQASARLYKTGDLARYLTNGNIEFLGRIDNQLKLRGRRVELGDIESALGANEHVRQAAVVVRGGGSESRELVAFVAACEGVEIDRRDLRRQLRDRLPEYMIPSTIVVLAELPLTTSGKIDRKQLLAVQVDSEERATEHVAPRTTNEELVAGIWADLLRVERVGASDNFFDRGGHSLLAIQMISRVAECFHVDVPLRKLFDHPTVEEFAQVLDDLAKFPDVRQPPPVRRIRRDQQLPFSVTEGSRLFEVWLAGIQGEEPSPFYVSMGLHLKGHLNVSALEDALNEVIRRHEILRTSFSVATDTSLDALAGILEKGIRAIASSQFKRSIRSCAPLSMPVEDLEELGAVEKATIMTQEFDRSFACQDPPLLRASLFRISAREHRLILLLQHIAFDRWSAQVLRQELATAYDAFSKGSPTPGDDLSVQYVDFADWQQRRLQGEILDKTFSYWNRQLSEFGLLNAAEIPHHRPPPNAADSITAFEEMSFDTSLSIRLRAFARESDVTVNMLLLTALNILLHLYTGKQRIGIWGFFANRTRVETEALIGWFANRHIIAADLSSDPSAAAVLDQLRDTIIEATAHSEIPFALVRTLQMGDEGLRAAVLGRILGNRWQRKPSPTTPGGPARGARTISFDMVNMRRDIFSPEQLVIESVPLARKAADVAVRFVGVERETHIAVAAEYAKDEFLAAGVRGMIADFREVLQMLLRDPTAQISAFASIIKAHHNEKE